MKLLTYPDERLRAKTCPVEFVADELRIPLHPTGELFGGRSFVEELGRTMVENRGVGIAAIQVGAPARLFLVAGYLFGKDTPLVFINPELLIISDELETVIEGCLSCPGLAVEVERPKTVVCRARDIDFNVFDIEAEGPLARVILHEYDHLQGKLIAG